jgi:hypothetical protein
MGDRTHPGVAADSRRSTDLIQAIRVPVGRGVVAAVGVGAGAGPMYLLDPDPDLGASPAGSDRGSAVISYLCCARVVPLDRLGDLSLSVPSRADVSGWSFRSSTGFWEYSMYAGMAAGAARHSTVGFLAIYHTRSDQPFPIRIRAG